jgi:hypothetical protein
MNLDRLATLIEILGNFAVIVSVLFLVGQARLGIRMLREGAERNHMEKHQSVSRMLAENPQLADVWSRGGTGGTAVLTPAEKVQFINFFTYLLRLWEENYRQRRRGLIDPAIWDANIQIMSDIHPLPGAKDGWAVRRHLFTREFQEFYDSRDPSLARPLYDPPSTSTAR